jgi:hypothetical protein
VRSSFACLTIKIHAQAAEDLRDRKGPDDAYELSVYLLYSVDRDPEKAKATAMNVAQEITRIFREHFFVQQKWQNIELLSCDVLSEEGMTVRQGRLLKQWNLDYISLRDNQPLLAS